MKPRCAEGNIEELSIQITSPRRLGRWLELFAVVVHQVEVLVTLHQRHSLSAKNQKFPVRFCNSRPLPNQYTHSSQSRVRHQPHHFGLLVHRSFIDLRAGVGDSKASSRMENREVCYSSSLGCSIRSFFPAQPASCAPPEEKTILICHALLVQRRAAVQALFSATHDRKLVPQAPLVWMTFHNTYIHIICYISICGMRMCVPKRPQDRKTHVHTNDVLCQLPTQPLHTFTFHNVPHTSLRQHNWRVHHPLISWKKECLPSSQDETPKHQPFVFHWAPAPLSFFPGGPPIPET